MSAHFAPGCLQVLGTGLVLPGPPIDNDTLLSALKQCAGPAMARKARFIERQLGIESRHLSRRLDQDISVPEPDAPSLCVTALERAAQQAELSLDALQYLIGHTATPHTLVPPNLAWVAERLQFKQPYMELRQACTGFANSLQIAAAMLASGSVFGQMAIVGSEVGAVYFRMQQDFIDPQQLVNYVQMGDGVGVGG